MHHCSPVTFPSWTVHGHFLLTCAPSVLFPPLSTCLTSASLAPPCSQRPSTCTSSPRVFKCLLFPLALLICLLHQSCLPPGVCCSPGPVPRSSSAPCVPELFLVAFWIVLSVYITSVYERHSTSVHDSSLFDEDNWLNPLGGSVSSTNTHLFELQWEYHTPHNSHGGRRTPSDSMCLKGLFLWENFYSFQRGGQYTFHLNRAPVLDKWIFLWTAIY